MKTTSLPLGALLVLFPLLSGNASVQKRPLVQQKSHPAPLFEALDTDGLFRPLRSLRGKNIAFFVFCGCEECKVVATKWVQLQKQGALPDESVVTLISYLGSPEEARAFQQKLNFSPKSTIVIADSDYHIAMAYRALPCPAAFILDDQLQLVFSSKELDPQHRLSEQALVALTQKHLMSTKHSLLPDRKPLPSSPVAPGLQLTALCDTQTTSPEVGVIQWTLNQVHPAKTPLLKKRFTFRNRQSSPITIDQVQGSCGCQGINLYQNGVRVEHPVLKPGAQLDIEVTVSIEGHPGGSKSAYSWVYAKGISGPVATVKIIATVMLP